MGIGGALVTLSAGAVSLIVLPAVLVALGPRINALAPARLQRSAAQAAQPAERGAWYRLAHGVMRRPGLVALGTAVVLIVIALPALRLQLTPADAHVLPSSAQPRQVAEAITHDFAVDGSQTVTMVVHAPQSGAAHRRRARAQSAGRGRQPGEPGRAPALSRARCVGDRNAAARQPTARLPTRRSSSVCAHSPVRLRCSWAAPPRGSSTRRPRSPRTRPSRC